MRNENFKKLPPKQYKMYPKKIHFLAHSSPFCNVVSSNFKNFYDHIQLYKPKTCMVMQLKKWMIDFLSK